MRLRGLWDPLVAGGEGFDVFLVEGWSLVQERLFFRKRITENNTIREMKNLIFLVPRKTKPKSWMKKNKFKKNTKLNERRIVKGRKLRRRYKEQEANGKASRGKS